MLILVVGTLLQMHEAFLAFPAFLAGRGIQQSPAVHSKLLKNSWGLFGGKWEAKTDFCGLGGQIKDPYCGLYPCGYPAFI
jgi:hypothetical protein